MGRLRNRVKKTPFKTGVLRYNVTDYFGQPRKDQVIVEIQEIQRQGKYSKVKVISMSGIAGNEQKRNIRNSLKGLIERDRVEWLDGN